MTRSSLFLLLTMTAMTATAQDPAPAQADTFEREALKVLKASHAQRKGIVIHVGGQTVSGIVKAIGPDAVIVANRDHAQIIVRRERIDAIEGD